MYSADLCISKAKAAFGLDVLADLRLPTLRWIRRHVDEFSVELTGVQIDLLPRVMIRLLLSAKRGHFLAEDPEWWMGWFLTGGGMFSEPERGIGPYVSDVSMGASLTRLSKPQTEAVCEFLKTIREMKEARNLDTSVLDDPIDVWCGQIG